MDEVVAKKLAAKAGKIVGLVAKVCRGLAQAGLAVFAGQVGQDGPGLGIWAGVADLLDRKSGRGRVDLDLVVVEQLSAKETKQALALEVVVGIPAARLAEQVQQVQVVVADQV